MSNDKCRICGKLPYGEDKCKCQQQDRINYYRWGLDTDLSRKRTETRSTTRSLLDAYRSERDEFDAKNHDPSNCKLCEAERIQRENNKPKTSEDLLQKYFAPVITPTPEPTWTSSERPFLRFRRDSTVNTDRVESPKLPDWVLGSSTKPTPLPDKKPKSPDELREDDIENYGNRRRVRDRLIDPPSLRLDNSRRANSDTTNNRKLLTDNKNSESDKPKNDLLLEFPLNLSFLTEYLKNSKNRLDRLEGDSPLFRFDQAEDELLLSDESPVPPKCDNPKCDHKTHQEDPTEITVPEFEAITTIGQIIEIAESFHCQKNKVYKGINMEKMFGLVEPLRDLEAMIGLTNNKVKIVEQILFFIKNFQDPKNRDMMHTVITGPPGTGKTTFARIIGRIYSKLGLVSKGHFVEVTREDLVGKYLGHTAPQTTKTIEKCKGGIMFIDEVYSLGHTEKRDSFSKECIDVLNQKLSENRDMLCIIAGYRDDIEKCFFNQNKGLKRRFPFVYDIEGYTSAEMLEIFKQKIRRDNWHVDDDLIRQFQNRFDSKVFKYYGGDIETFVFKTKIAFAQTHFYSEERKIDRVTLERAFKMFEEFRKPPEDASDAVWKNMYI